MGEIFLELGKALFSLANMLFTLIFVRSFWDYNDIRSLIIGIVVWVSSYALGFIFIYLASRKEFKQ